MKVTLLGVGMGNGSLTTKAQAALGKRMSFWGPGECWIASPASAGSGSLPMPQGRFSPSSKATPGCRRAVVAYSGDTGFYSGARQLLPLLEEHGIPVEVLPGISTVQALAARLGIPWQEFCLVSAHGVDTDVLAPLLNHPSVFYLTGGSGPRRHLREFCRAAWGTP